ncbi:MAG: hypothetical protein A2898_00980 [Candidatus Kerfeldbacteria bacterium RIFCSPLOWO2_01_FULL_48_11]|uniref:Inositol-1-monophosphatase n=1 Tax=Candidatus Kerfeldbacteria bacterium RIFCSPLOWO2_01_FULL_48_11 TaxID=1798543 RepID=A0A1G2B6P9_9BACT|nr:MAG: Inositol monophosphatase [Parcubacteria group bacterium GW2011_GWA2_48_9]OGY84665.1 MAG: hypothetical protein A2898_00980 [Candidatus Kerfeldbacteria bacterium RIFCSPLOWO2_01_FULL_48_11]HCM68786.1 hypothetical protein [Candidatus Kerfeldbacteria bacterium]
MTYRSVGVLAAHRAGVYLAKHFRKIRKQDIRLKKRHEVLTSADLGANKIILKILKRHFPSHDFLSEETGLEENPQTYKWFIDPLDGTTNYSVGNPLFCTTLSLAHGNDLLLSIIYAPMLDEFYIAEKGKGATLNGKRIHVSPERRPTHSIITIGYAHTFKSRLRIAHSLQYLWKAFLNTRVLGSGSLNLAFVAAGRVEGCYLALTSNLWDTTSGVLLVKEAGGIVTDLNGKPWDMKSQSLVASNRTIHARLLRNVRR